MEKKRSKDVINEPEKLVGKELKFTLEKGKKSFSFGTIKAVRKEGNEIKLEFDPDKPGLGKPHKGDGKDRTGI
jgi:hypothetical protein